MNTLITIHFIQHVSKMRARKVFFLPLKGAGGEIKGRKIMEFFSSGNGTWELLKRKVGKSFPQG
jgi:hypothetical protein